MNSISRRHIQLAVVLFALFALALLGSLLHLYNVFQTRADLLEKRENTFLLGRPFQRLQREVLNLSVIVASGTEGFTPANLQLQRDITASRFFDINTESTYRLLTPELLAILSESEAHWGNLQPDLQAYIDSGLTDQAHQQRLAQSLKQLELAVNKADSEYVVRQDRYGRELTQVEGQFLEAQILTTVLLVLAILLGATAVILQLRRSAVALQAANSTLLAGSIELDRINQELALASRLKSEFLATMSHELRTPLNDILGYSGLILLDMNEESKTKTMLSRIEASGKHLLQLINDILDISKIESGRMILANEPIELPLLVNSWVGRLKVLADAKGLEFHTMLDSHLPAMIEGDSERLTQIATNLLSNAIKFTDQGQVSLDLKRHDHEWIIEVQDTGKGIPADALEYIFDEFRQVDGSYQRVHGGTGLGLAIVRKLVHAMQGNIRVTSQLGQGSSFRVTLPLKPYPQEA
jgi:signal transduction histidine kinase